MKVGHQKSGLLTPELQCFAIGPSAIDIMQILTTLIKVDNNHEKSN